MTKNCFNSQEFPKLVLRAAVYARYSSEMQSSSSARDQVERVKALAAAGQIDARTKPGAAISIDDEWVQTDEAKSGRVAGRRGYQVILAGIRQRAFDLLIVDDLSRLTRSLGNLLELYQLLRHFDVELISVSDRVSSADPNARTFFTVKGMVADFGNEAHSERTLRGLEARARDSFSTGNKPFGYGSEATRVERRKGKEVRSHFRLFIVAEKARVVRKIFETFVAGHGKVHIAKMLNAEKIPSPAGHIGGWKPGTIFQILRNEKYTGRWVFNQITWSTDPDTGRKVKKLRPREQWLSQNREDLRIIAEDLWEKSQAIFKKTEKERGLARPGTHQWVFGKADRADNKHLLSGLLTCSVCGSGMVLASGRRGGYYGCFDAFNRGNCSNKGMVSRRKIEATFVNLIREKVADPRLIDFATRRYNEIVNRFMKLAPGRKQEIEGELQKVSREIEKLVHFVIEGDAEDLDSLKDALREREAKKKRLRAEFDRLAAEPEKRLLVTPHLVKVSLQRVVEKIVNRGPNYNGLVKELLSGPLVVTKGPDGTFLEGSLDLGESLGASQFILASPILNCPNPSVEPVIDPFRVKII